jgi:hypothetical protein
MPRAAGAPAERMRIGFAISSKTTRASCAASMLRPREMQRVGNIHAVGHPADRLGD